MDIAILFGTLFVLLALSVPIGISLGIATAVTIFSCSHLPLVLIAQNAFTGMDSFPMLAIPFFMLSGSLMTYGGISRRIVDMAECFVGFITGGLAMVTIVACMFFGAISGSAAATVSAIGSFMVPMMVEKKYKPDFAAAVISSADGVEYVHKRLPMDHVTLWTAAVDEEMTVKSYIVPGIGDPGDLAYGKKL